MENYLLGILVTVSVFAILAVSLDLLIGYTGLFTIVHGALFGTGAYVSAILALRWGISFPVTLAAAAVAGGSAFGCVKGVSTRSSSSATPRRSVAEEK